MLYAVRYLVERISWLARDNHNPAKWGGDGSVELLFSNRQGMSYDEMRDYLRLLKRKQETGNDIRIEFDNVPVDKLRTFTPGKSMGLQLADATAGAFFSALENDRFGNTEPRYVQTLAPIIYRNEGVVHGYGFKLIPREAVLELQGDENLSWISDLK